MGMVGGTVKGKCAGTPVQRAEYIYAHVYVCIIYSVCVRSKFHLHEAHFYTLHMDIPIAQVTIYFSTYFPVISDIGMVRLHTLHRNGTYL